MKFSRDKFFAAMQKWSRMNQAQIDGLVSLLNNFEADEKMTDARWIAYALATVKHETGNTYRPIEEYGKGRGKPYGKADKQTGQTYYGRGYVQLTWKDNYETMGNLLFVDLVNEPEQALDSEIAYRVMSIGMREGLFTGKRLGHYIHGDACDYTNARRIINGLDKAALIAGYARRFETILDIAKIEAEAAEPAPVAIPAAEQPSQQTVETGGAGTQVVVGGAAAAEPVVSQPDDAPIAASTGGKKSLFATVIGGLTAIPTAIWGLFEKHDEVLKWSVIVGGAILAIYLLRQLILDVVRMWTASDPKRYSVK